MFRSSTIIRELALNLAKVIFMSKHSVKLRRYYYVDVWQHVLELCVCVCCMPCKLPDDGRRPKHVGAIFLCIAV